MVNCVEMLGGVLVLGRVAAANVSATQAEAQMHPSVPHFYAFFADMRAGFGDLDLIEMGALLCHKFSSLERAFSASSDFGYVGREHHHSQTVDRPSE